MPETKALTDNQKVLDTPEYFSTWRRKLNITIFGYHTPAGRAFDIVLLIAILLSIGVVMIESVSHYRINYATEIYSVEWFFTFLFTLEYIARIISHPKPSQYVFSFMGLVDLASIIPTYISLFIDGSPSSLMMIRTIRLVRVFRILKLTRYIGGAATMSKALWLSRFKITVFLGYVLCIVVIVGTLLYVIEGGQNGFTSIPRSIYWAVVTLTTVGYGDIAPQTVLGQTLASIVMILGYAIIAVPTGIVTGEMISANKPNKKNKTCDRCKSSNSLEANYCSTCGEKFA